MSFESQQAEIVSTCRQLLADGVVDTVVGFRDSGLDGMGVPCILTDAEGAGQLVWNNRCVPNLAQYLKGRAGKTAIVAKPCDVRAIVNLIVENQLRRDDIHIVGVTCPGMQDSEGTTLHGCRDCRVGTPPIFDTLVDDPDVQQRETAPAPSLDLEANLERFQQEMEKCILCYSCRQACYGCYCETCFMDRGVPNWQPAAPDVGAKMTYHLGRAMHLSGRCVECGACENACASGVDIRYLIREVTEFVDDLYGYRAGMDPEAEPVMLTYQTTDREVGFLGGEAHA